MPAECCQPSPAPESQVGRPSTNLLSPSIARASSACDQRQSDRRPLETRRRSVQAEQEPLAMKFGIHLPSWVDGPAPAEAFEVVKAKAQWAENHGFVWFSVQDHMIQTPRMGV